MKQVICGKRKNKNLLKKKKRRKVIREENTKTREKGPSMPVTGETIHDTRLMMHV